MWFQNFRVQLDFFVNFKQFNFIYISILVEQVEDGHIVYFNYLFPLKRCLFYLITNQYIIFRLFPTTKATNLEMKKNGMYPLVYGGCCCFNRPANRDQNEYGILSNGFTQYGD